MKTILNLCWSNRRATANAGILVTVTGRSRALLATLLLLGLVTKALPQALPLEIRQDNIQYNLRKVGGLPISTVTNVPPGSDGRGPTLAQQQASGLTEVPATSNQFVGFTAFGASVKPARTNLNPVLSLAGNAENLDLPRVKVSNQVVIVMLRGRVAGPYLGRGVSFQFGEIVPRPDRDEYGVLLSTVNTNVTPNRAVTTPEAYWLPEPYTTANHTNALYYWSPNAQAVFAANAGPLTIPWRRSSPSTTNATPVAGVTRVIVLGVSYVVATNQYVISGSPVKTPRLIYWTERSFAATGKPVTVPSARVGSVNIVYNNNFPERVRDEVDIPDTSSIVTSNSLQELRTLWFDQTGGQAGGQIRSYNVEGRVFVELLGDVTGPNTRQHLGFEIVDVIRQPAPNDVTIELGEQLTAYPDGLPDDSALFPEPLFVIGQSFTFQQNPGGSSRPTYYAIRETANQNDLQVHWLQEGLQGLRWPFIFVRYKQVWPDDVAKYSHYVRPLVATEAEAKATAVALPSQNAPFIAYQDPLDQPRGKLTENFAYYSFLDAAHPAHRALLRFTSGEFIRFERVFSWLDQALRERSLTLPTVFKDFEANPPGGQTYGDAFIADGILHLTDALYNQNGSYILDDFVGSSVQNFRATFRASVRNGTIPPADGFSFNFGTIANGQLPGEEGIPDGLSVTFDIWDNGAGDQAPGISVKRNGATMAWVSMAGVDAVVDPGGLPIPTDPATGQPMTIETGNQFVPVEIVLGNGGLMDVSYKGVKVLANVATGYTPRTGRFGLGGRAGGGANTANWIDDLVIVVNKETNRPASSFAGSVATNLNTWVGDATFLWPNGSVRPRVVDLAVNVGDRIGAPAGELGSGFDTNYLAGFIRQAQGNLFNPAAYVDPFAGGFEEANRGAIIPVNAMPTNNQIEVWWFRKNPVNVTRGFLNSYWPAVIGRYTVQYPTFSSEIVLASNDGSGPLVSLQAGGSIYYQNDRALPGVNPNEEHAIMQGGQAFALRDDLNVTNSSGFTSLPFVLLSYT
ncbi:MAG: hypothetical protein JWM16_3976, partial [Verrucomicrobiales bacterium]|nr:hypothetical protein [Verrucomicrobiales bacterium]